MDGNAPSVSPTDLYARLGTATAPVLVDVRRTQSIRERRRADHRQRTASPEHVDSWRKDLPAGRSVVAYCVHGHEVSQGVAAPCKAAASKPPISKAALRPGRNAAADAQQAGRSRKQVGDTRASQDRSDCLSLADQPICQSRCGIHLRPCQRRCEGRRGRGWHAL